MKNPRTVSSAFGFDVAAGDDCRFAANAVIWRNVADTLFGARAMANAIGADPDEAEPEATPLQWIVRAIPSPTS